jgi:hypothetical protein
MQKPHARYTNRTVESRERWGPVTSLFNADKPNIGRKIRLVVRKTGEGLNFGHGSVT